MKRKLIICSDAKSDHFWKDGNELYKDVIHNCDEDAYAYNDRLNRVYISDSVTEIAAGVCRGCKNLEEVFISKNVRKVSPFSFRDCPQLKKNCVDRNNEKLASVNGVLFDKKVETLLKAPTTIKKCVIPHGVTSIGDYAFWKTDVENIVLPDTISEIGIYALEDCDKLKYNIYNTGKYLGTVDNPHHALITTTPHTDHITVHPETIFINSFAFDKCHFNSVYLPAKVGKIGPGAFFRCPELKHVYIPASAEFSDLEFFGCSSLRNIERYAVDGGFSATNEEPIIITQLVENRKKLGLCPDCGSELTGFLFKKCENCTSHSKIKTF